MKRFACSCVADAERATTTIVECPAGYYVLFGGQFTHLQPARTRLMVVARFALALIFRLLYFT